MKYLALMTENEWSVGKGFLNYASSNLYDNIDDAIDWIKKDFLFRLKEIHNNKEKVLVSFDDCRNCKDKDFFFFLTYYDFDVIHEINWTILEIE